MLLREKPGPVYQDGTGDVQMQMAGKITLTAEYHPDVDLSSRDYGRLPFSLAQLAEFVVAHGCAVELNWNSLQEEVSVAKRKVDAS